MIDKKECKSYCLSFDVICLCMRRRQKFIVSNATHKSSVQFRRIDHKQVQSWILTDEGCNLLNLKGRTVIIQL